MSEVDLRESLLTTLRYLLKSKEDIELQVCRAKEIIRLSCEKGEDEGMNPISIEKDAVWLSYLLGLLDQVKYDVARAKDALAQLGVSNLDAVVSNFTNLDIFSKSQGDSALDFSSYRER